MTQIPLPRAILIHTQTFCKKKKKMEVEKKGHNAHTCNNWQILPQIDFDLYFMIIYLCMKYESKTLTFFKMSLWPWPLGHGHGPGIIE